MNQLETYKTLFDSSSSGIFVTDSFGKVAMVNRQVEKLFGYCLDEIKGKDIEMFIPDRFKETFRAKRTSYINNPVIKKIGTKNGMLVLRKDDSEFFAEISISPIIIEDNKFTVVLITDISESKKAADDLKKVNERYRSLLHNLGCVINCGIVRLLFSDHQPPFSIR